MGCLIEFLLDSEKPNLEEAGLNRDCRFAFSTPNDYFVIFHQNPFASHESIRQGRWLHNGIRGHGHKFSLCGFSVIAIRHGCLLCSKFIYPRGGVFFRDYHEIYFP